jgi:hypothetical protein
MSMMALALAVGASLAAFPVWLLIRGVRQGVWNGRGVDVVRSEHPLYFWFGIAMYGVFAAIMLTGPLYLAYLASR